MADFFFFDFRFFRGHFGICSGFVRDPFRIRLGSVRGPFGVCSGQFRTKIFQPKIQVKKFFNLRGRRRRGGDPPAAVPSPTDRRASATAATAAKIENLRWWDSRKNFKFEEGWASGRTSVSIQFGGGFELDSPSVSNSI